METHLSKVVRSGETNEKGVSAYTLREVSPAPSHPSSSLPDQIGGRLSAIERDAYERGFASGERAGRELGLKQIEASHQLVARLIEELQKVKPALLENAEKEILQIAVAVARRILRQEISHNPEHLLRVIRAVLQKMGQIESLVIRLHPHDLERLRKERNKVVELIGNVQWFRLEPDASLLQGECLVESNDQIVDLRIDSQLSVIEEELLKTDRITRNETGRRQNTSTNSKESIRPLPMDGFLRRSVWFSKDMPRSPPSAKCARSPPSGSEHGSWRRWSAFARTRFY
ncbi:MAG: FliH/SctL family protein [Candidatus Manganitrophus sp.]|nr:FliH/SctL family protein [Candidatus Manganitrophus sp.]